MMEKKEPLLLQPFQKIAGWPALGFGMIGIAVSVVLNYYSGYHYHGLMHFGPVPNNAWWMHAIEPLVVWIFPAILFFVGGMIFSKSRIRTVDVFGTVAFAQLPLVVMNLTNFLPSMQRLLRLKVNELHSGDVLWSFLGLIFFIWMLIWMFKAVKVSCNLKGWKLWVVYLIGVIGGDLLCRWVLSSLY